MRLPAARDDDDGRDLVRCLLSVCSLPASLSIKSQPSVDGAPDFLSPLHPSSLVLVALDHASDDFDNYNEALYQAFFKTHATNSGAYS